MFSNLNKDKAARILSCYGVQDTIAKAKQSDFEPICDLDDPKAAERYKVAYTNYMKNAYAEHKKLGYDEEFDPEAHHGAADKEGRKAATNSY